MFYRGCINPTLQVSCNLSCSSYGQWPFFILFRCGHVPDAGASCRGGADSRGQGMASEEFGSCPNSLAKTYQPKRRHTALFGVSKQGEASNN